MTSADWMKICSTVALILFAKCVLTGARSVPVVNIMSIDDDGNQGTEGEPVCNMKELTTVRFILKELTHEVEIFINEEKEEGSGFYNTEEPITIKSKVKELTKEVDRLVNEENEEGSASGNPLQEEKEEGSASCTLQELRTIKSKLEALIQEVKGLMINDPKPTLDQTDGPTSDQACSDGWDLHGDSCFYIIDTPTPKWRDARRMCLQLGADLAKITSATENQYIFDLITKQKTVTRYGVWLGLHRKADKKFYWVDYTPLVGYMAWAAGEPNNANGAENCAHKIGGNERWNFKAGKWNDVPCSLSGLVPSKDAPVVLCQKMAADLTSAFSFV